MALSNIKSSSGVSVVVAAADSHHPERADYVGDGSGEQDVIQAAIDELPDRGGKIELQGHFYTNGTIHMYRDVAQWFNLFLQGEGLSATRIELVAGSNCDMIDIETLNHDCGWKGVADMTLAGNKAGQSAGHGIHSFKTGTGNSYDQRYVNVFVYQAKQDGFHLEGAWGIYLDRCLAEYGEGIGLYLDGAECYSYGFHSSTNDGHGVYLKGSQLQFSNSRIYNCDTGIHATGLSRSVISGNVISDFGKVGGDKRGICLDANSYRNNIQDNIITGGGGSSDYGIMINTSTTIGLNNIHNNIVSASDIYGAHITWTGASGSKIIHNIFDSIGSISSIDNSNIIMDNMGINPVGVSTTAWHNTSYLVRPHRSDNANPTVANQDYAVCWTPCRIISSGGTGVAIVIKDSGGTTICSPGATCDEYLEPGEIINFGNFSAAPTTVVVFK